MNKSNPGGPASSLTPEQRRLSARNNSREAFEAVNGGKLPAKEWLRNELAKKNQQTSDEPDQHTAIRKSNEARERLALKQWQKKT